MKPKIPRIILGACWLSLHASISMAATRYVNPASPAPSPPYTSWATAATTIQDAVDEAVGGDTVMVTNGHYLLSAEILVETNMTIRSVNGPSSTIVDGQGSVRCFNLGNHASVISGLTITNGGTALVDGGGIHCTGSMPVITNCLIIGNIGYNGGGVRQGTVRHCTISLNHAQFGGGIHGGSAYNCTVISNSADYYGGGMASGIASNCTIISNSAGFGAGGGLYFTTADNCIISGNSVTSGSGGGMSQGTANNCILSGNNASSYGGGMYQTPANSCLIYGNHANSRGGGMYGGTANNCTLVDNTSGRGGGIESGSANNSILWDNMATIGPNFNSTLLSFSCSPDATHGANGNITNAPLFVDEANDNYHLLSGSPCINAGMNSYVTTGVDLDGNPRISDAIVDMGAYEWGNVPVVSCSITNMVASSSQVIIEWTVHPSLNSEIRWTSNLTNGFQPIATNLYPQNSYTDTLHTIEDHGFYEVQLY